MNLQIEIRPGEGGQDAKLLTTELASIYTNFAHRHGAAAVTREARGFL